MQPIPILPANAMTTTEMSATMQGNAVWVVFGNVLLQQLGLPVPAVPTLLAAGSMAMSFGHAGQMLAAAMVASVFADSLWYVAGRTFGYRVLSGLCRLSLNPGSCVSGAEALFMRWGARSLVVAKFVPGFSTVGPPIAGSFKLSVPSFVAAAGVGAGLWAGSAMLTGWLLRDQVHAVMTILMGHEAAAIGAVALALALWLGWVIWKKRRFEHAADIPHITPADLVAAMNSGAPPLLLDLRGPALIATSGSIAGAIPVRLNDLTRKVSHWPRHRSIVTVCSCPNDATAVRAARSLMELGYSCARPLKGGYDSFMRHAAGTGPASN
jgi:membrane protein DedA with SNARE-associated domain/rhodanese-related sulfurtransferase